MRMVLTLTVAAVVVLVIAVLTGSAWPALAVVALAAAGLVLLVRDWRATTHEAETPSDARADHV